MLNILNHQGNVNANNSEIQSLHSSKWLRSKTPMTANAGDDVEEGKHFSIAGGSEKLYSLHGNQYGDLRYYISSCPVVAHIPLVPALGRKGQVDLCEFKVSLAYRVKPCIRKKIRNQPISRPCNSTVGHIPKGGTFIPQAHLHNYVHSNIIHKSQILEAT